MTGSGPRSDPPLISRLTWRDPLRAETLISQDRGLMARTYGSFFLLGSVVATIGLLFGQATEQKDWLILLLVAIAVPLAMICFVGYRRLPQSFFLFMNLAGTAMITIAVTSAPRGAEGIYAIFYVWMALLAGLFFRRRVAAMLIAVAPIAFGAVIYERDAAFASNWVIMLVTVLGTSGLMVALLRGRVERLARRLAADARTDPLTGLANRRAFEGRFELESNRSLRSGDPLSIAFCDLDGFKTVNDRLGHQAGDEVLGSAAAAIRGAIRTVDVVARLGGDEFGVILPGAEREEAHGVGERIRLAVGSEFASSRIPLTISVGLATAGLDGQGRSLIRAADLALYEAKRRGRDRTTSFEAGVAAAPGAGATVGAGTGAWDDPSDQSVEESSTK